MQDDSALFNDGVVVLNIQLSTGKLLSWKVLVPALAKIDPAREPFGHVPDHVVSMGNLLSHGGIITWSVEYEEGALCECTVYV